MPEAKKKAETEKPLSPEFQANRSMFRYRPESRKRNFKNFWGESSKHRGEGSDIVGREAILVWNEALC